MTADDMFQAVEAHCSSGMDFITVHCGVTRGAGGAHAQPPRGGHRQPRRLLPRRVDPPPRPGEPPLRAVRPPAGDLRRSTTSPSPWATACAPAPSPTPPTRPRSPSCRCWASWCCAPARPGCSAWWKGPGHVPLHQVETNIRLAKALCQRRALLRAGAAGHRRGAGLRPHHRGHRRGPGGHGRRRLPLLRDPPRAPGPAPGGRRTGGDGGDAHRRPRRRHRRGAPAPPIGTWR